MSPRDRSIKEWEKRDWKVVKVDKHDEPTWTIYTREIPGTTFIEYKIEGNVRSNPEACLSSFKEDIHNQANDIENKKFPTYQIIDESKNMLSTYVIHHEPFPLKDTEMSVKYNFFKEKNGALGVNWRESWDESPIQPSKKLKRVETFRGSWCFSPDSNNLVNAVNSVQFNPKKMPKWLFEPMVVKFLKGGLEDIRTKREK